MKICTLCQAVAKKGSFNTLTCPKCDNTVAFRSLRDNEYIDWNKEKPTLEYHKNKEIIK